MSIHFFASEGMAPEDVVWEERKVALPAWMWRRIDEANEEHEGHQCYEATPDLFVAMGMRHYLGDPSMEMVEARRRAMTTWLSCVKQIRRETTERPITSLAEWGEYYFHCYRLVHDIAQFMTLPEIVSMIVDSSALHNMATGHRLSLIEDVNTVIAGATTQEEWEALKAALRRLGEEVPGDGDEG